MKTIKEAELREIIQEELVNELFGLFKKKKRKPVHSSYNKTSLETRGFKRIREFFGVLDEIKKQITGPQQQKILQILNQPFLFQEVLDIALSSCFVFQSV